MCFVRDYYRRMKEYIYNAFSLHLIYIGVLLQILSVFQFMSGYKNICIIAGFLFVCIGFVAYLLLKKKQH